MADDKFGVLVGWTHQMVSGRLILTIESVHSLEQTKYPEVDRQHLHMTLNQATVLYNFLLSTAGAQPPIRRRRGWFAAWVNNR